jgi:hypothetical protein
MHTAAHRQVYPLRADQVGGDLPHGKRSFAAQRSLSPRQFCGFERKLEMRSDVTRIG